MNDQPKATEPGLSLSACIARMDAEPKTAEQELAIADFMMLPQQEQMRVLFCGLIQNSQSTAWCIEMIKRLTR